MKRPMRKWAPRWVLGSLWGTCFVLACGSSGIGGGGAGISVPQYPGAGTTGGAVLMPGTGPATAKSCTGDAPATPTPSNVVSRTTSCFYSTTTTTSTTSTPAAAIEQIIEVLDGKTVLHLRITFDPGFVDNTYGANAIGWTNIAGKAPPAGMGPGGMAGKPPGPGRSGHTFQDLVGSDHVEILVHDA